MRRVRFIYWSKRVYHSVTLKIFLLGTGMTGTALYVSLPNIVRNMPSIADVSAFSRFFVAAFFHTQMPVQIFSLFILAVLVWTARDLVITLRGDQFAREGFQS